MTRNRILAIVAVAIVVAAGLAFAFFPRGGAAGDSIDDVAATASITTAPVRSEVLQDVATAYGVVQADPSASTTLAAPRPVIVTRVLAQVGETVGPGQPLLEVASQPGADLAYRQAADAATFARSDLDRVQRLFDERLAAADQLGAAKKTLADAQAALAAQQRQGGGQSHQVLSAGQAAVVVSVTAAPGDHVAQDAPLLVLARQGALSVKLGLEPTNAAFAAGDAVTVRPAAGGPPFATRLTMVGRAADPATKTIDAVAPLFGATLPIGATVEAEVVTGSHQGLAVPRAAVVFDETGAHVFVIEAGKARRVFVTAGRDHGDEVEVSGPIAANQIVAVQGAYELQDGMAVKVAAQ
jgi:RND family efflux transporter MFP subunit